MRYPLFNAHRLKWLPVVMVLAVILFYALKGDAQGVPSLTVGGMAFDRRDLGIPCGGGLYLFGDTFSQSAQGHGPLGNWIAPNSGSWSGDAALFMPMPGAWTVTPTGCTTINGVFHARYMEIRSNEGHNFSAVGSGIATSQDGVHWTKHPLWSGDGWQTQAALVWDGPSLYAISTEAGRTGPAVIARIEGDPTQATSYRFWNGADFTGDVGGAVPVIGGAVGEMSFCHDGVWNVLYMTPDLNAIVLRTAPALVGPWSSPLVVGSWVAPDAPEWGRYAPQFDGSCQNALVSDFQDYAVFRATLSQ